MTRIVESESPIRPAYRIRPGQFVMWVEPLALMAEVEGVSSFMRLYGAQTTEPPGAAAAGDPHSLFCVNPRELADCIKARVVPLGE